ncbi:hypothetical protein ACFYRY_23200 [Streptomyces sp. NPDC005263]|uniref:hypothetical protein n=1 Tax=Streptomyces sp. NPDC005263 TaxID=3364711 RepID=UPI0036902EBB
MLVADGTCLHGAKRPDGSQLYIFSAVRHQDALTWPPREIRSKTNEITDPGALRGWQVPLRHGGSAGS